MYRKELEGLLNSSKFPNYFLLFGADEYQIELFAKEILEIYMDSDSNLLTLYFDEYNFNTAISHINEPSLFASSNILHIKTDKKIPPKELKELIESCKNNQNNKFLFEFYEMDSKITLETSRVFNNNFARFFKPNNPDEAVLLLSKTASKLRINITKNALYEIYFLHNENLYLAASELPKLATLGIHVDQDMVKKLVFGLSSISFEDFFNKFMALKDIRTDYVLIEQDPTFNEIMFINLFYKSFFRLFKLYSYIKINGKFDIKDALGYAPPLNIVNLLKQQSMMLSIKTYEQIFKILNLAELDLKTKGFVEKSSYMIALLIKLQNTISTANIK